MTHERRKEAIEVLHGFVIRVAKGVEIPAEVEAQPMVVSILSSLEPAHRCECDKMSLRIIEKASEA